MEKLVIFISYTRDTTPMDGKITDGKNLAFIVAALFIALFVGISFVNVYVSGILLAIAFTVILVGVFSYGMDEKDY